jgi:NAD-dependent dihydropyrimidine dehydrogenase PreA subunit
MTFIITDACVDVMDRSCIAECPVDCIYEGERMLYINPVECVDCGACEAVCPSNAVFYEMDVPDEQKRFEDIQSEWAAEHEARGGSKRRGVIGADHPFVAALPPNPKAGS